MDTNRPILRPKPFKHFPAARVIYIPVDLPSGLIAKHLREKTSRIEMSEWGTLIAIPDKTVVFKNMGAPLAVMTLERLLAGGAGEILVLGFCGALTPRLRIGTAVSAVKAYADEGTSRHYAPGKKIFKPGAAFQKAVEDALRSRRLPFVTAKAVSTDAPFRETPSGSGHAPQRLRGRGHGDVRGFRPGRALPTAGRFSDACQRRAQPRHVETRVLRLRAQ